MKNYYKCCLENNNLFADDIIFESNELNSKEDIDDIVRLFVERGYYVSSKNDISTSIDIHLKRKKL